MRRCFGRFFQQGEGPSISMHVDYRNIPSIPPLNKTIYVSLTQLRFNCQYARQSANMQDLFVTVASSWAAEASLYRKSQRARSSTRLLENKNGSRAQMSHQPLSVGSQIWRPRWPARRRQIPVGLCAVLLDADHSRLSGQTVRQELPVWEVHQWVVHLWPRMGRRPVSALPGEVQVSGQSVHEHYGITQPPVISLCAGLKWFGLLGLAVSQSLCVNGDNPVKQSVCLQLFGDGWQHLDATQSVSAISY